MMQIEQFCFYS